VVVVEVVVVEVVVVEVVVMEVVVGCGCAGDKAARFVAFFPSP